MFPFFFRCMNTLFFLFLYRLGSYIVIPGLYQEPIPELLAPQLDLLLGGAASRVSFFSLHLVPLLSMQLLFYLFLQPRTFFQKLKEEGKRETLQQWIQGGSLLLAIIQSSLLSWRLMSQPKIAITFSPLLFYLSTVLFLTLGSLVLHWIAQQITQRGIGQGVSLLLLFGMLSELTVRIYYFPNQDALLLTFGLLFLCFFIAWVQQRGNYLPLFSPPFFFERGTIWPLYLHAPVNVLSFTPLLIHSFLFSFFEGSLHWLELPWLESPFYFLICQGTLFWFSFFMCFFFFLFPPLSREWISSLKKQRLFFSSLLENDHPFYFRSYFLMSSRWWLNGAFLWLIHMLPLCLQVFYTPWAQLGINSIMLFLLVRLSWSQGRQIRADYFYYNLPWRVRY